MSKELMNNIERKINSPQILNNSIQTMIDIFTKFYGEENRDYITEKFHHMILFSYYDEKDLEKWLFRLKTNISDQFLEEVFHNFEIGTDENERKKHTMGLPIYSFEHYPINNVCNYIRIAKIKSKEEQEEYARLKLYNYLKEWVSDISYEDFKDKKVTKEQLDKLPLPITKSNIEYYLEFDIEDVIEFEKDLSVEELEAWYSDVTPSNIDELIQEGTFDKLLEIGDAFQKKYEEYHTNYEKRINQYEAILEKEKELHDKIESKYYKAYLLETKKYLNQEDQERIDRELASSETVNIYNVSLVLGSCLKDTRCIDFFDEASEADLKNPTIKEYRKETIQRNRIRFFQYKGINLGNHYEDYVNSDECKKIWPDEEMLTDIRNKANHYKNKANIEFYSSLPIYKEAMKRLEGKDIMVKGEVFLPYIFTNKSICVLTNMEKKEEKNIPCPVLCLHIENDDTDDLDLIHELNHIFEYTLLSTDENIVEEISGWDLIKSRLASDSREPVDTLAPEGEKRQYELLSEVVNELIAEKITKQMHDNGIYIIDDAEHYQNSGSCLYTRFEDLIHEFIEEYWDLIVESRRNNNMHVLLDQIGKENFDELADLFTKVNERFMDNEYEQLRKDLKKQVDNDAVREFNKYKEKIHTIFMKMKEYTNSHENKSLSS